MKILYVCNDLNYFNEHRLAVSMAMLERGHEVIVASGMFDAGLASRLPSGIRWESIDVVKQRFAPVSDLLLVGQLRKLIGEVSPDIVHAITIKPNLLCSLTLVLAGLGIWRSLTPDRPRLVMTFPGLGKVFEPGGGWRRARLSLVGAVLRWTSGRLESVATVENLADASRLADLGILPEERIFHVRGAGIALDRFTPAPKKGPPKILFAGRLLGAKGLRIFLAAARRLAPKHPQAVFMVAGRHDPEDPDHVPLGEIERAEKAGSITFLGHVPFTDMPELLRRTDVLCLPTMLMEGFPRTVIEAAACGCAVVASDQPSVNQLIDDGRDGWLLPEVTRQTVERALEEALTDISKTREMGRNAAVRVRMAGVSDELVANAFAEIYLQASRQRQPR